MYESDFLWEHFHFFLSIVQKTYDSLIYICTCVSVLFLLFKRKRNLFQHTLYFFDTYYSQSVVVFNEKSDREIIERIMDSESEMGRSGISSLQLRSN
jgi:hypothetical protein